MVENIILKNGYGIKLPQKLNNYTVIMYYSLMMFSWSIVKKWHLQSFCGIGAQHKNSQE